MRIERKEEMKTKSIFESKKKSKQLNPNPRVKIGGWTHLGLGAPLTAGYRRAGKSCAAARQGAVKNRPPLTAGAHACGIQSEALSTASSTVARSPNSERASRRASRGGASSSPSRGRHGRHLLGPPPHA